MSLIPEHMRDGMKLYIERGVQPGSFMEAVLCNDLREALGRADHINRHALFNIVSWLFSYAPSDCWGSPEKYTQWIKQKGLNHAA